MVDTLERKGSGTSGAGVQEVKGRRALPNRRAILGALLITASVFGVFWSWAASTRPPTTAFVTATRDLSPGETLSADDLVLTTMDLPTDLARRSAFTAVEPLVGSTVLGPLGRGELVQARSVRRGEAVSPREMSFAIESSRALGGRLAVGERIDVLATIGSGGDAFTTEVVRAALVLRATTSDRSIGSNGTVLVTLGLASADDALALAHALNVADVFLVRTSDQQEPGSAAGVYRTPSPTRGSDAPSP